MDTSAEQIEKIELKMLNDIESFLQNKYEEYFDRLSNKIGRKDLVDNLAGQGTGRAKWPNYDIGELIKEYPNIEGDKKMELEMRLVSLDAYGEGLEKFLSYALVKFFNHKNIRFKPWITPNASDSAFLIEDFHENTNVILHVDAKTISGFKNYGDALEKGTVAKHQLKWNQTSYVPELLRCRRSNKNDYIRKKYSPLDNYRQINGEKYITVTLFLVNLSYMENEEDNSLDFSEIDISGEKLENIAYIGCVPNGMLESDYYDKFFRKGKNGYDEEVPKDARISYIKKSSPMEFKNLNNKRARARLIHPKTKNTTSTKEILVHGDGRDYEKKNIKIVNFSKYLNTS